MSMVWDIDLPPSEKLVLLSLADQANDTGTNCWPAVETIARRSGQSARTVRRSLASLEERGHLSRQHRGGTSTQYHIHPCHCVTPDTVSPLTDWQDTPATVSTTPATVSPKPLRTTIETPSKNIARAEKPADLDEQVWQDWKRVRKKPITPTVMAGVKREADKLGWTVAQAITHAAESSWQGFKADWIKETSNGNANRNGSGADKRDGAAKALDRRFGLGEFAEPTGRCDTGEGGSDSARASAAIITLRPATVRPDATDDAGGPAAPTSGRN